MESKNIYPEETIARRITMTLEEAREIKEEERREKEMEERHKRELEELEERSCAENDVKNDIISVIEHHAEKPLSRERVIELLLEVYESDGRSV